MRDPRLDPYTVTDDDLGPDRVQPRDAVAAAEAMAEPAKGTHYTPPAPPPAGLGFDLAKWRSMSRAERRAVLRYAAKQR